MARRVRISSSLLSSTRRSICFICAISGCVYKAFRWGEMLRLSPLNVTDQAMLEDLAKEVLMSSRSSTCEGFSFTGMFLDSAQHLEL
jgi:hypothetical protein